MTDRDATIIFNMISGIGYVKYRAMCEYFGSASQALEAPATSLVKVRGVGEQLALRIESWRTEVDFEGEMELVERAGARVLTLLDEAYPKILRELHDPPLVLYVRGTLPEFGLGNMLAVVGSRRVSRYGEQITATLTSDAIDAGFSIISGLALGVDAIAHRAAVDKNAVTVGVLGGGLMRLHPQENVPLARAMVENGGAVITEFPMNFPVSRNSFPRRNRIVARLADGVLVTEAGLGSGALITANLATENNITVMAVPGRTDNPQSKGCHKLIKSGANLVEDVADIVALMNSDLLSLPLFSTSTETVYNVAGTGDLAPELNMILSLLAEREHNFDQLIVATQMDAAKLGTNLMMLEMKLLIQKDGHQNYILRGR